MFVFNDSVHNSFFEFNGINIHQVAEKCCVDLFYEGGCNHQVVHLLVPENGFVVPIVNDTTWRIDHFTEYSILYRLLTIGTRQNLEVEQLSDNNKKNSEK